MEDDAHERNSFYLIPFNPGVRYLQGRVKSSSSSICGVYHFVSSVEASGLSVNQQEETRNGLC